MAAKKKPSKKTDSTAPLTPKTTREARKLIKEAQRGLLVFTAEWCGPCRAMKPALKKLAKEGVPVIYIDIDVVPKVAEEYGVQSIPAVWRLQAGKKPEEGVVGAVPEKMLRKILEG